MAVFNTSVSSDIFFNALIKPSLFRVISTADASAKYSLFLEIASCINLANIGAKIIKTRPIIIKIAFPLLSSSSLDLDDLKKPLENASDNITIKPTITTVTV